MKAVKYGAFDMQANGVVVLETDVYSAPTNKIQADALAERDGALVVKQQYDSKPFTVTGYLRADTQEELEMLMDVFKAAMAVKSQPFEIAHAGGTRRYLASARNDIISRNKRLTTATFSVEFFSPDGMGWDIESTDLIESMNISLHNQSIPILVEGSYKADPIIKVTVNTVTGGTAKTISLGNAETLRSVQVTRTWVAGDVLEMDTLKGELLVNGEPEEYRGALLSFQPGPNALVYNDDFTTRDVTILSSYTRRWL